MSVTFSIVVPTIGRASLKNTLASIKSQELVPQDEVILVGDGHRPEAEEIFNNSGLNGRYIYTSFEGKHGRMPRTLGIGIAQNDFIMLLDDDDTYVSGMLREVRATVHKRPGLYLYKTQWPDNGMRIPKEEKIYCGNVTSGCVVTSNIVGKIGRWEEPYNGDFAFIYSTAQLWGPKNVFYPNLTLTLYRGAC